MNCCLCGATEAVPCLQGAGWQLVRCSCGMIRTDATATQAVSYAEDDYFVARNRYVQQWEMFSRIFDDLMDRIVRYRPAGRLLDVGAGVGTLVDAAARQGFTACGVELSEWASRFAREEKKLAVHTGTLESAGFPADSFDVVTINHVLEHIEEPAATLAEIRRILVPGGLLVVGVPNIGSIMARLKGARWASLRPDEHIWHFTPATLKQLASQAGFDLVHFESRDNYPVTGWGAKEIAVRVINSLAVASGRSEAMLLYCTKPGQTP